MKKLWTLMTLLLLCLALTVTVLAEETGPAVVDELGLFS